MIIHLAGWGYLPGHPLHQILVTGRDDTMFQQLQTIEWHALMH